MKCLARGILLTFGATLFAATANATVVLDFTGLQDHEYVDSFYNNGTGSLGSIGTNYGVAFTGFQACGAPGGSCSAVINEPSTPNVAQIAPTANATMNVVGGFDTGFSLFYTNISADASLIVWSGVDGTGVQLATLDLPVTPPGAPATLYSNWAGVGVTFAGTAKSVTFDGGGQADLISFDNLTLGSSTPVGTPGSNGIPEPLTLSLFGAGLAGMAAARRRSRATA